MHPIQSPPLTHPASTWWMEGPSALLQPAQMASVSGPPSPCRTIRRSSAAALRLVGSLGDQRMRLESVPLRTHRPVMWLHPKGDASGRRGAGRAPPGWTRSPLVRDFVEPEPVGETGFRGIRRTHPVGEEPSHDHPHTRCFARAGQADVITDSHNLVSEPIKDIAAPWDMCVA
jgi:hypothetical protein